MQKQRESRIEDFAFDYLKAYYTQAYKVSNVLVSKAEISKNAAEADGLFVFTHTEHPVFTASLHTGNSDKLASLLISYKKTGLGKLRFLTAFALFAGFFLLIKPVIGIGFALPVALFAGITGFILHTYLKNRYLQRKIEYLVSVLKKLPANDQWLGISISSLTFRNNALADYLNTVCKRRGIGLITVGKRSKVILMQEPRTATCRKGDFLSYYTSEANIRKALSDDPLMRVA
ncbi:hypothetical protein [Pontibacter vulgaris]|uniref:hypothetical protein n=1 Tax=Pontibacter vulgaris TaxID=2905679 RepID=UPI001FA7F31E|nr:hypothetical protein [Pontibacter vulgaris]